MTGQIPINEKESILRIIAKYPEGISLGNISEIIELPLSRRNIQHRLLALAKEGLILAEGKNRGRVYRPVVNTQEIHTPSTLFTSIPTSTIPLSKDGMIALQNINKPTLQRKPVGYNRKFLDAYRPNVTFYLSEPDRKKLMELGKTDGERPAGTYARMVFNRLLIDLSWNSSRLEGNTYSLLETERLLELNVLAEGKDFKESQMILNHKEAIEFLVETAEEIGINRYTILNLHALLSNGLLPNAIAEGSIRKIPVGISETVYYPLAVPDQINECFEQILDTATAITDPFEQAFFLMVHLPYLQPFEDVNKRVSRLAANIPLIRLNLAPLSFIDLPQKIYIHGLLAIYELNDISLLRDVFIWAYERSSQIYSVTRRTIGEPNPFKMRYRSIIYETVSSIVNEGMNINQAVSYIKKEASNKVSPEDQSKFIETVEIELSGLHEGNIARYRIRPSVYKTWHQNWI